MSSLTLESGDYIKGQTVTSTYYVPGDQWYPDILLKPTESYLLKVSSSGTLIYPETQNINNDISIYRTMENILEFNPHQYQYNGSATIKVLIDDIEIDKNDEIRAYFNEELRGLAYFDLCPLNNEILSTMMIYSNNNATKTYYNSTQT